MLTKTENHVPYALTLAKNFSFGSRMTANFLLAPFYSILKLPKLKRAHWMVEQYDRNTRQMQSGGLSAEAVDSMINANEIRVDGTTKRKLRDHGITDERLNEVHKWGMVQKGALLLRTAIEQNRSAIRSVANVGARIDPTSSYMAGRFPDIQFTSIDMQRSLGESNKELPQHPNWNFLCGYALGVYRDTDFRSDLVYMTSTSPKFNAAEMRAYSKSFKDKRAKLVIMNEAWWVFPLGLNSLRQPMPEDIDPDTAWLGGFLADFHHNYPVLLDRAGFDVVMLRMLPGNASSGGWHNHLQVVAINRDFRDEIKFDPTGL